jgi:hypothetical protein
MSKTLIAVCLVLVLVAIVLPALASTDSARTPSSAVMAASTVQAIGITNGVNVANPAENVPFNHWAYDDAQKLVDQGITIGYPDGMFRGNRAMTRYERATPNDAALKIWGATRTAIAQNEPKGLKGYGAMTEAVTPAKKALAAGAGSVGLAGQHSGVNVATVVCLVLTRRNAGNYHLLV